MIYQSLTLDTSITIGRSYDFLLLRGVELPNQVFPIYLVLLKIILMFLFALFFVLMFLEGI